MDVQEQSQNGLTISSVESKKRLPGSIMIGIQWVFLSSVPVALVYLALVLSIGDRFSVGLLSVGYILLLGIIFIIFFSTPAVPLGKAFFDLQDECEAEGQALAEKHVGRPMLLWVGDVDFPPSNTEFAPTGLGWDGERLHVLSKGMLASFPPSLVCEWRWEVDGDIADTPFSYTNMAHKAVAQIQATAETARRALDARRRSGLFIDVRDVNHARWHVQSTDEERLARAHELLRQLTEGGATNVDAGAIAASVHPLTKTSRQDKENLAEKAKRTKFVAAIVGVPLSLLLIVFVMFSWASDSGDESPFVIVNRDGTLTPRNQEVAAGPRRPVLVQTLSLPSRPYVTSIINSLGVQLGVNFEEARTIISREHPRQSSVQTDSLIRAVGNQRIETAPFPIKITGSGDNLRVLASSVDLSPPSIGTIVVGARTNEVFATNELNVNELLLRLSERYGGPAREVSVPSSTNRIFTWAYGPNGRLENYNLPTGSNCMISAASNYTRDIAACQTIVRAGIYAAVRLEISLHHPERTHVHMAETRIDDFFGKMRGLEEAYRQLEDAARGP